MQIKMQHHIDSLDWTVITSVMALLLSKVAVAVADETVMSMISSVSAVILCLTAIVKFVDLLLEKWNKWKKPRPKE